jgi:hypothetical protein
MYYAVVDKGEFALVVVGGGRMENVIAPKTAFSKVHAELETLLIRTTCCGHELRLYLLSLLYRGACDSRFLTSTAILPLARLRIAADLLALALQPLDNIDEGCLMGKLVDAYGSEEEILTSVICNLVD